jgi:hypothetical protein
MPDDFDPVFEQRLADLSDVDWQALTERVRPPTSAAQLREIAGKVISGDKLDAFVKVADPKAFASENGDIDPTKVQQYVGTMFGQQNGAPGDAGRAAAAKRFGTPPETPAASTARVPEDSEVQKGRPVRDPGAVERELQKRFGDKRFGNSQDPK